MSKRNLPISKCHSKCPRCKVETDFMLFESGAGGDFETYYGYKTETFYRVDMHKVHYLNIQIENLLEPATKAEGGIEFLKNFPDEVKCKLCGSFFHAVPITFEADSTVEAVEL